MHYLDANLKKMMSTTKTEMKSNETELKTSLPSVSKKRINNIFCGHSR